MIFPMNLPPIPQTQTANLQCYTGNQTDLNYVVNTINKIRKANNLPELTLDQRLNDSASKKAQDMIDRNYWSHEDPEGKMSWNLIKDSV